MSFAQRGAALLLPLAICIQCDVAGAQSAPDVGALIVGNWRVAPGGFYAENPDGSRNFPFGQDAVGRVIMTADGYAANSFQRTGRAKCATGTRSAFPRFESYQAALSSL